MNEGESLIRFYVPRGLRALLDRDARAQRRRNGAHDEALIIVERHYAGEWQPDQDPSAEDEPVAV